MSELLVLTGPQVQDVLDGREEDVLEGVRQAYVAHAGKRTSVPHSTFLRFSGRPADRIIALPAYLGDGEEVAGVKWVSSFPGNTNAGTERASAVIVLNSMTDGRPTLVMEGSVVNAWRTAASSALAARFLHARDGYARVGAVGCGRIQFEILRFLHRCGPPVGPIRLFDVDAGRRGRLAEVAAGWGMTCIESEELSDLLASCDLISLATTAAEPYISDLGHCPPGTTVLNISLRDLAPEVIAACENVVDDADHVCRANTSLDLAARRLGRRDFIRCSIGEVLAGDQPPRADAEGTLIFSPFGLGILDLSTARLVRRYAEQANVGTVISDFQPANWLIRASQPERCQPVAGSE